LLGQFSGALGTGSAGGLGATLLGQFPGALGTGSAGGLGQLPGALGTGSAGRLGATLLDQLPGALGPGSAGTLAGQLSGALIAGLGRQDSNGAATGIVAGSSVRINSGPRRSAGRACTDAPSTGVRTPAAEDVSGTVRSDDVTSVPGGVGRAGRGEFGPPVTRAMSSLTAVFSSFAIESPHAYVCDVHAGSRTHVDFARETPHSQNDLQICRREEVHGREWFVTVGERHYISRLDATS
jgi:hypothetical protein